VQTIDGLTTVMRERFGSLGRGWVLAFGLALALVMVALSVVVDGGSVSAMTTLDEDYEFLCYAAGGCG
jgi:hypothetical protein